MSLWADQVRVGVFRPADFGSDPYHSLYVTHYAIIQLRDRTYTQRCPTIPALQDVAQIQCKPKRPSNDDLSFWSRALASLGSRKPPPHLSKPTLDSISSSSPEVYQTVHGVLYLCLSHNPPTETGLTCNVVDLRQIGHGFLFDNGVYMPRADLAVGRRSVSPMTNR
jgi:hypothetical protein